MMNRCLSGDRRIPSERARPPARGRAQKGRSPVAIHFLHGRALVLACLLIVVSSESTAQRHGGHGGHGGGWNGGWHGGGGYAYSRGYGSRYVGQYGYGH